MQKTDSGILWTAFVVKIAPGGRDRNAATSKAIRAVGPAEDTRADRRMLTEQQRKREKERERKRDKRKK